MTFEAVRKMALALRGTVEAPSYRTPGFKVAGKLFARFHQDGEWVVVRTTFDRREQLLESDPETFTLTPHYRDHPWILVRVEDCAVATMRLALRDAHALAMEEAKPAPRRS
jgi:hypothetical protein